MAMLIGPKVLQEQTILDGDFQRNRRDSPDGTCLILWKGSGGNLGVDANGSNLRLENGNALSKYTRKHGY